MSAAAEQPDPKADPRTFRYIQVRHLVIDERTQREVDLEKAAKIGHEFDWARFEALTVAPLPGGPPQLYVVVEGSHRTCGAKVFGGLDLWVPCLILPRQLVELEQAQIQLDIVRGRRGHSAYEQWRLRYNAGHPHEIFATASMDKHGVRVGRSPGTWSIGAVATVRTIIHGGSFTPEYGAELLDRTIAVILRAYPEDDPESNTSRWDRSLLLAVSTGLHRFQGGLDIDRFVFSLRTRPAAQWINIGKGTNDVKPEMQILATVLEIYNRNRKNRIAL